MKITIDGVGYELDVSRAQECGILKKKKRPVVVSDIPNGSIFRWIDSPYCKPHLFVMLDKNLRSNGQIVDITSFRTDLTVNRNFGNLGFFTDPKLEYYDRKTSTWINEI
jgi:hypothetical protein